MSNISGTIRLTTAQALSAGVQTAFYKGDAAYLHIRYAPTATPADTDLSTTPNDFVGFCANHDVTAPTTASSYSWARINSASVQAAVEAFMEAAQASATSAGNSATAAAASEASIDSMVDTIAKQTIAEQMLAVLQQEAAYLQTIAENGGAGGNLNGFSLNLENDAVVLSYTNPTDGTDTRSATFPTKTTGDLIVAELAAINATLRTMVPNTNA